MAAFTCHPMLYRGPTPSQPNFSVDGSTLYKHAGSIVARARARPIIGRSPAQVAARNIISVLSILWENPLTDAQRAAWGAYAYNTPLLDAYGVPRYVRGYAHFMRSNRPRLHHGLPVIMDAPTTPGIPDGHPPTFSYDQSTSTIAVAFDRLAPWASQLGSSMVLYLSRPQQHTRNRPPEVYAPLGRIDGATTPPASPATFMAVLPALSPMSRYFVRSAITYADGSYSATVYPTPDPQKQPIPPQPPIPPAPNCFDTSTIARVSGGVWSVDTHGHAVPGNPFFPATCPWIGTCFWQVIVLGRWVCNVTPVGGTGNPTARVRAEDNSGPSTSEWHTFSPTWWSAVYTSSTGNDVPTNLNVVIGH